MKQAQTKAGRIESRQYQFDSLIKNGYQKTEYKNLVIFSHPAELLLKTFWGTAANHTDFFKYRTAEQLAAKIESLKQSADSREKWKADQKEKNKGKSSSHAGAAAAIKSELKAAFPGIKFSVTSDSFSMGDSVHITWTDGPTTDEVKAISGKYQYGRFDGMTDMYEYSNRIDNLPQSKYVSESRSQSETIKAMLPDFEKRFLPEQSNDWHNKPDQIFYRIFSKTSFPANYTDPQILKTDCMAGSYEDFYMFSFTSPDQPQQPEAPQIKEVEVKQGEVNIIEYGKGIAVIGDTKPIKDNLKALGGSFNPRLSCGVGWIFPKTKLEAVKAFLIENKGQEQPPAAEPQTTLKDEVKKTIQFFTETDIKQCGEVTESTKECARVQNIDLTGLIEETPQHYDNLQDMEAAVKGGKVISLLNMCELVNAK